MIKKQSLFEKISLNIRLFFEGAFLSYIALFHWLRPMTYLASKVMAPLTQMLFFVFIGAYASGTQNAAFYVIGNALIFTASSGIFGVTMSIGGERWSGTLPYLFGTPANRMALFIGRAFMHILDGMLGVFIGLLWGVLLFSLNLGHTDLPALILTILITTFSTAGLGLLMGCLSLVTRNVMFVNNSAYFLLLIFSGANLEIATLPRWMQSLSNILPLTRGVAATRALIAGGTFNEVSTLLIQEILIGVVFVLLGYLMFRRFEYEAKVRGTLEVF
jgi:ABC-2 type transport system permease protein